MVTALGLPVEDKSRCLQTTHDIAIRHCRQTGHNSGASAEMPTGALIAIAHLCCPFYIGIGTALLANMI